jgi:peptidoglycan hydrolase-like protein with peptidoglycan-binding domain
MIKTRPLATLLVMSSVVAISGCDTVQSWFGGGSHQRQSSQAAQPSQSYTAAPNYNPPAQTAPMQQAPAPTVDTIRDAQKTLQQDGIYHGRVDGRWGPTTQAAVRDFQQQHNMNASGQLDQDTLAALNIGQNNTQQPPTQHF